MTQDLVGRRDAVLDVLRRELIGPAGGAEEEVTGKPAWRYLTGILFPRQQEGFLEEEEDEMDPAAVSGGDDSGADSAVSAAYDLLPASMGLSFYLEGARELRCRVRGARYRVAQPAEDALGSDDEGELATPNTGSKTRAALGAGTDGDQLEGVEDSGKPRSGGSSDTWQRIPLGSADSPDVVTIPVPDASRTESVRRSTLDGCAEIAVRFRPYRDGHLVTVTMMNALKSRNSTSKAEVAAMLFQCGFDVTIKEGAVASYPQLERYSLHPEDEELALVYRNRRSHGIGHGCAAVWDPLEATGQLRAISAEPLPTFEVRGLTNRIEVRPEAELALDLRWLADPARTATELEERLRAFLGSYQEWCSGQVTRVETLESVFEAPAGRLLERQRQAVDRIGRGIDVLVNDADVRETFRLAQEAMLRQFAWTSARKDSPFDLGHGRAPADPMAIGSGGDSPTWFPFQLAFQLLVLPSLIDPTDDARDVVDLLWFPTGGGKTEAYLALAAMEMIHRRRRYADAGTAVIMRYTLRLLTSQQFERCTTVVSVLESMRRGQYREQLGEVPFRLGLWVGGGLTPNDLDRDNDRYPGARQLFEQLLEAEKPENPFLLRSCPRCGTRLVPLDKSPESHYGIEVNASAFRFFCPDTSCELNDEIPASVVDDDLFRRPPTFLIGTIDKFARMVWDARSRVFLGRNTDALPPTLVIQDELHLINGPLGSIAGGYEAGIETVIRAGGGRPKYLASTATIQRALEQCHALYAREPFIFPPAGLDAGDSFFSREDDSVPGRLYCGVMGNGLYSSLTTLIQVSAASAHAPTVIEPTEHSARDTYWTQVIYHNSKQELGKTTTMLMDDVRSRLQLLEPEEVDNRKFEHVEELSANLKGSDVSEALERLGVEYPDAGVIDVVACTNMISVGVDVGRLGLMLVKGQPKNTAEYIQATSRIGRDPSRPPGVVVTLYSPLRPRDRSHFETFQSYHAALYRAVEPTSVTPFSAPARERTLHAGLVLSLRHVMAWEEPRDAGLFRPDDPDQKAVIDLYRRRILGACRDDESDEASTHLDRLVEAWVRKASQAEGPPLTFAPSKQFRMLLTTFPRDQGPDGLWATLNSMRHVDGETPFTVRGQDGLETVGRPR